MNQQSEARRAAIRIVSNYARLFITVSLGLYLARVLLQTMGNEGFGLIALLGSTTGFAAIIEQVASWSMIRELGSPHHSGDESAFRRMFNSALVVSGAAAVVVLLLFAVIIACLPLMNISEELLVAAKWFVTAKGIETAVLVLLTPQFNMYLITERMAAYNFWLVMRRLTIVLGGASLFWLNPEGGPARGIILYGWMSCGFLIVMIVTAVALITRSDRRLVPRLSMANRLSMKAILRISGWNLATQSAVTLALPTGAIIMNMAFGLQFGNMVFGFGMRLAGYTRMLASGMTVGLDAASARMTAIEKHESVISLIRYSTALHGVVVFPAMLVVAMLTRPMLDAWIGADVENPEEMLPRITTLVRIMLLGFMGMCLNDCWTRILYGAGHIRRYAKIVILGNVMIPLLGILYLAVFPDDTRYTAVACAFATIYLGFFCVVIPGQVADAFHINLWQVLQPLWRPLATSVLCAPVLLNFVVAVERWNLVWLILAVAAYGVVYALISWFFTLGRGDRDRLKAVAFRVRATLAGAGPSV